MLNYNYQFFIQLISSFVNNNVVEPKEAIDWEKIIQLAKIHNLKGLVFTSIDKLDKKYKPNDELYNKLKRAFLLQIKNSNLIDIYVDSVKKAFERENIDHIFLKGYDIKTCYPIPEVRSMSDVDLVIREKDRAKSDKILKEMGFVGNYTNCEVWDYTKKGFYLEVHTSMICDEIKNNIDYGKYFSNPWENSYLVENNTYRLKTEYHLIFLIVHMAKHFVECGCGIRMILDIDLYIRKYSNQMDWNYIWNELKELELDLFAKNIMTICNKWFDTSLPIDIVKIDNEFYEELTENILLGGVFGFELSNYKMGMVEKNLKESNSYLDSSFKVCKSLIFPPYEELIKQKQHSYLINRRYLLVVAWIYRIFYILIARGKQSLGILLKIILGKDKAKKKVETMEKLGL